MPVPSTSHGFAAVPPPSTLVTFTPGTPASAVCNACCTVAAGALKASGGVARLAAASPVGDGQTSVNVPPLAVA